MINELMEGIFDVIHQDTRQDAQDLRKVLNWYCWGTVPDEGENGEKIVAPYMSWHVIDTGEEETAFTDDNFDNTVDYYQDITVQFGIATYALTEADGADPAVAQALIAKLKNLFRMQSFALPSGRVLCSYIQSDIPTQSADADGVDDFVVIMFRVGT